MDRVLPFFDPPLLRGQFLYPERGQKQTFFDPLPPRIVHLVIEWPLMKIQAESAPSDSIVQKFRFRLFYASIWL